MKQFAFSLGRVLEFKNQLLDREKNLLAQLRRRRLEIERMIGEHREEFQRVNHEMTERTLRGITALALRSGQYQLDGLRYEIVQLQARLEEVDAEIEKQLTLVLEMSRDVSGLDKLKEHQREDYNRQEAKAVEAEIAEFVSGKLIRQKEA